MLDYENIEIKDLPPTPAEDNSLGIETALALQIQDLTKQLEQSKANANDYSERWSKARTELYTLKNTLKDILVEQVGNDGITPESAKYIAEGCEIELTKTVTITGTVTFSATVDVSMFEDVDDMSRYNLYGDLSLTYDSEEVDMVDYDIEEAEFEESEY
jgi:hypothetical protein